jgi:hemerythrin superfamily protein
MSSDQSACQSLTVKELRRRCQLIGFRAEHCVEKNELVELLERGLESLSTRQMLAYLFELGIDANNVLAGYAEREDVRRLLELALDSNFVRSQWTYHRHNERVKGWMDFHVSLRQFLQSLVDCAKDLERSTATPIGQDQKASPKLEPEVSSSIRFSLRLLDQRWKHFRSLLKSHGKSEEDVLFRFCATVSKRFRVEALPSLLEDHTEEAETGTRVEQLIATAFNQLQEKHLDVIATVQQIVTLVYGYQAHILEHLVEEEQTVLPAMLACTREQYRSFVDSQAKPKATQPTRANHSRPSCCVPHCCVGH